MSPERACADFFILEGYRSIISTASSTSTLDPIQEWFLPAADGDGAS